MKNCTKTRSGSQAGSAIPFNATKISANISEKRIRERVRVTKAHQSRAVFKQIANYCINRLQAMRKRKIR